MESVVGILDSTFESFDEGVCPACIEYFGKRNPDSYLTNGEYQAAVERYPEPVWASSKEISRAEMADAESYEEAFDASQIGRHRPDWAK
jgi:hypothetical protein